MYLVVSSYDRNESRSEAFDRDVKDSSITRIIDVLIAVMMLIFFSPLILLTALVICLQDGGPIFFGHTRVGRGGRTFKCFKFRSMVVDAQARLSGILDRDPVARREWAANQKMRVDPRVTPFGALLRKASIDELPQLFNVLRGEMSMVGPRPIVRAEVVRYGRAYAYYCAVRPGITGLWQVSGRNDLSYRRRVALDVLYARTRSLGLDTSIMLRTVPAILLRRGAC
ncbi:sugar transferase [Phenylobacterium sp. LjRoot225]|uniref:sugar transferase n=1 Tax=Phenylobacterium sp. LjRoot225 TaxID=3342285 RepID=UPI003ECFB45E